MWVTVWRHGEAGMAARDEDRCLTTRGERSVAAAALAFHADIAKSGGPLPYRCAFSPLVRTQQTANLLGSCWNIEITPCAPLAPGTDLLRPDRFLVGDVAPQVIVSHQPFVSQLLWHWLDDDHLEPLSPGGWATVELSMPTRGGGRLIQARPTIFQ